jgi:hypothetical protein
MLRQQSAKTVWRLDSPAERGSLASEGIERLRDARLTEAALVQTGAVGDPYDELEASLSFNQIQYALVLDSDLVARLSQEDSDNAYKEVVKRLMNYGSPGRQEYYQAMATQWRIGERSVFLENVLASLDHLAMDSSAEAKQAIVWAYQEAKLAGGAMLSGFGERCWIFPQLPKDYATLKPQTQMIGWSKTCHRRGG